jgi:hypothetical protein
MLNNVDGFVLGVPPCDPTAASVKLLLEQEYPNPEILIIQTTTLIETLFFLSD